MINNPHILALLARERQQTLIAQAQAARLATRARVAARVTRRLVSALGARHAVPAPTELVRAVLSGDVEAISGRLTDGPIFHSPIRSYADRRDVVHLLALIGEILPAARAERNWRGNGGAATMISADLGEAHLQGVVEELHDPDGRVREVTLMLRPHAVMMCAIRRMATALEISPLPSASLPR